MAHRAPGEPYHIDNYKLTLRFDPPRGEVIGLEELTLVPRAPSLHRFYLDSTGLVIDGATLLARGDAVALQFERSDPRLWITLDRRYNAGEALRVQIRYHGFPRAGLYFVNPTARYPHWPREIWSQGEPEFNHFWFPCWDFPNDMSTSETVITVPRGQTAISNGKLVARTRQGGEITYDWIESVPHSAYLTSVAIGPWKEVKGHHGALPVDYYVAPGVSAARTLRSFSLTPDMIGFFSRAFGVPYPYEKYSQVTVKNYPFGGQENVSATTLTDATLHGARAEPEYSSQLLVAHELGQQWFGDLVQARDWADIWLNEGFATYLEALYTQYHDGDDAFRLEMLQEQRAAQEQDRNYVRPIVDDHYRYPLQMFDSITHEKGAAVLDMLRSIVDGSAAARPASQEERFFRALRTYLTTYRAHAVNTADLIKVLDRGTSRDLGGFFREWVYGAGYPQYVVSARYDARLGLERITVTQRQKGPEVASAFVMPIEISFHGASGQVDRTIISDRLRRQEFTIPVRFRPLWVDFDPDDLIDKTLTFVQALPALIARLERDPAAMSRLSAAEGLGRVKGPGRTAAVAALTRSLANDDFYGVRTVAAASLGTLHTPTAAAALLAALRQPDSRVRVAVIEALADFRSDRAVYRALVTALQTDQNDAVAAAAARGLGAFGRFGAFSVLRTQLAADAYTNIHVVEGIFAGMVATSDPHIVPILLSKARPGVAERLRVAAMSALEGTERFAPPPERQAVASIVRAALADPALRTRLEGESLASAWSLERFRDQIRELAHKAPTDFERDAAQSALKTLDRVAGG